MTFSGTIQSDFLKLTDIPIDKRPNLINFAATDFLSLRTSLLNYARAVYPEEYNYFVESDLGLMLIELTAYMGAVMSMKADMLANENFLATAKQRSSVKKLLELIGIRMKGPVSSAANAKLSFSEDLSVIAASGLAIGPSARVVQITSPEDGAALNFTLYKVVNGLVDLANDNGVIELSPSEESSNPGAEENIFENLVLQEGALVTDSGDFAATEALKSIKLSQGPVVEGSVEVFINSNETNAQGAYREVDNIYFASGSSDKIFEVSYDQDYQATVIFGDNTVGISPDAAASYFITYRVGGGSRGNIASNSINSSLVAGAEAANGSRTVVQGTITNTSIATGGTNAETLEHAKRYAPLKFRTQDRLVTLEDYTAFTNTFISNFGTIGKAVAATRKAYSSANVIDIYVLEKANDLQFQKATTNFKTQLLDAIEPKKMATDDVVIVDGLIRTLDLVTTIRVDREQEPNQEQIKAKVRDKILEFMSIDNREFGQDIVVSDINRKIFETPEVRLSTIDNVAEDVRIDFNEIAQINNITINIEYLD